MDIDLCSIRRIITDLKDIEEAVRGQTSLSLNEALCLCQHDKGNSDPSSLAKEMGLSPSRMTRILDSLSAKGYIERLPSEQDRRSVSVRVTAQGSRMTETLHSISLEIPTYLRTAIQQLETATGVTL
ncbi:MAG: MarR family transcriptional regulator [Sphaerochaetaceae bacterium]|nr:MarR family transcriptional regulator [Sphaerochaetaceae bacterium]